MFRFNRERGLMMRIYSLLLAILALSHQAVASPLKICFEDVPQRPWTLPDGSGLSLDLLHLVEKKTGEQFELYSKPWKRCIEEVRTGQMDGIVGAAETAERRTYAVFPTLANGRINSLQALFEDSYDVFVRKDSDARWNGKKLNFTSPKGVLIQHGYAIGEVLGKRGIVFSDTAVSADDALRQLSAGMFDIGILLGMEAKRQFRDVAFAHGKIVRVEPPYVVWPFFLMIGKQAYARDPKRINLIWEKIAEVRASPKYKQMEKAAFAK
jgi:polar amino acid transport system substrate-binding protein